MPESIEMCTKIKQVVGSLLLSPHSLLSYVIIVIITIIMIPFLLTCCVSCVPNQQIRNTLHAVIT
jgi:hypothetical protein